MLRSPDNTYRSCAICGGRFQDRYWSQHTRSTAHKLSIFNNAQEDLHPRNGRIIRSTNDRRCYDVLYPGLERGEHRVDQRAEATPSTSASTLSSSHESQRRVVVPAPQQQQQQQPGSSGRGDALRRPIPELIPIGEAFFSTRKFIDPSDKLGHSNNLRQIRDFYRHYREGLRYRLEEGLRLHNALKINLGVNIVLQKQSTPEGTILTSAKLHLEAKEVLYTTDLTRLLQVFEREVQTAYDELEHVVGSNWTLHSITDMELAVNRYSPLAGERFFKLPSHIMNKKACINPKNDDVYCFKYAIAAKLVQDRANPARISWYTEELLNKFNFEGLTFPTPLKEITIFEKKNDAAVNVYGISGKEIYPLRISSNFLAKVEKTWDLLYLERSKHNSMENGEEIETHYVFIKTLSRLVRSQVTKHKETILLCRSCLSHFPNEAAWKAHVESCYRNKPVLPKMPLSGKNDHLRFDEVKMKFQQTIPYVIYADFETALYPFDTCAPNDDTSYTLTRHLHEPTSYCYYIVSRNPNDSEVYKPQLYRGPDAVKHFWSSIEGEVERIGEIYSIVKQIVLTADDERKLEQQMASEPRICHICKKSVQINDTVVDHCHLSGKFRGIAHNHCNLQFRLPRFVPIVFHNGSRYDFKLIIRDIAPIPKNLNPVESDGENIDNDEDTQISEEEVDTNDDENDDMLEVTNRRGERRKRQVDLDKISVIARSCENFISFEKRVSENITARFIDSFAFMSSSLSTLASNLPKSNLIHVRNEYPDDEIFNLASRKGVFPYEYITDASKYEEPNLPPPESFYNSLSNEHVPEEDYKHAQCVYEKFECHNLGEYSDHYLKIDTLLLADVFENFRDICLKNYKLDPAWHYSAPGLSWNAMLKFSNKEIELLTDYEMYLFLEEGIRGGFCQASKRYVKANNPLVEDFDPEKPENYILYVDANNLYGYSMCAYLPSHDYKWLSPTHLRIFNRNSILNIPDDCDVGYIFEVDLEYPESLHDAHNDMPLCPEKIVTPTSARIPKLIATLHNKSNYVVHYTYLKRALEMGLELKKIHRGIVFSQSPWLRDYITLNTGLRQQAQNDFERNFYKLMNNVIFGKCLESCRSQRDFRLQYKPKLVQRLLNKPNFKRRIILNQESNLCLIELARLKLHFDKPVQCGMSILDISKCIMLDFHYKVMKSIFPHVENEKKLELVYTDTDSLIYNIISENVYEKLAMYKDVYFDFSNYPPQHPCFSQSNHKVPGKFSDEVAGRCITEFVALRPKLYAFKDENIERKKAKGIKKVVVRDNLCFEMYVSTLKTSVPHYAIQRNIQSHNMVLYTKEQCKRALSENDDKRFILANKIDTLAWGHREIRMKNQVTMAKNNTRTKCLELCPNSSDDELSVSSEDDL